MLLLLLFTGFSVWSEVNDWWWPGCSETGSVD